MEIQIKERQTVKKEITLPYFFKLDYDTAGANHYAILSPDKGMRITDKEICHMEPESFINSLDGDYFKETSELEFTEALHKSASQFASMITHPALDFSEVGMGRHGGMPQVSNQ